MTGKPEPAIRSTRRRRAVRWVAILAVVATICVAFALATAANLLGGRNLSGSVTCEVGAPTGIFIEAERLPRLWQGGPELQSHFVTNKWITGPHTQEFNYWLKWGGKYSVHVGCEPLKDGPVGAWGSDNRTPLLDTNTLVVVCHNVHNDTPVTVIGACDDAR